MALAFRIIVNKKKAVTYCQQALFTVKVFIKRSLHCLLNILHAFYVIICIHMLKTCGIGKTVVFVLCARFKSYICMQIKTPFPTLRPRNSCICPCLSRRRRSTHFFSSAGGVNACAGVLFHLDCRDGRIG